MSSISAIICVKNQKYELRKSLESVYDQSVAPDEVVVIDASSDDSCRKFIENFADAKTRIVSIADKTAVPYNEFELLQIGLVYATCDYVAYMVAGDVWMRNKMETVKTHIGKNPDKEFFISSYIQKVGLTEKEVMAKKCVGESCSCRPLFWYWKAPSSVVVKRMLAEAFSVLSVQEMNSIKVDVMPTVLSRHYFGVEKDRLAMQEVFWRMHYDQIAALDVVQEAALFCIEQFQDGGKSKEDLELFAKTAALNPADVVKVVFGIKEFTTTSRQMNDLSAELNKSRRNYSLMRDWLEMKISGGSVADNLKAMSVFSIAIYGAGRHGGILFDDLRGSNIKIVAWVDRAPNGDEYCGVPVYTPQEFSDKGISVDALVVTPYLEYEAIAKELKKCGVGKCVSLVDIIK